MSDIISYCLFRKDTVWLAFPAKKVREVMPRPKLVSIPRTHKVLSGLGSIRSEFLPVLNLSSLLPKSPSGNEDFLMIIDEAGGDWGLLVDEVDTLAALEASHSSDEDSNGWESAVSGWATYRENVVRILDTAQFRAMAAQELNPAYRSQMPTGSRETSTRHDASSKS